MKTIILSISDHEDLRSSLRNIIRGPHSSLQLLEAISAEEGVEKALKEKPDIVLMDIGLHSLNGANAANRITAALPSCQIIMLTMYLSHSSSLGV